MGLVFSNNAESTLDGGINDSVTTLDVASGQGKWFPPCNLAGSGTYFYCTIVNIAGEREVIKVTEHTADSDTFQIIVRAQDPIKDVDAAVAYSFADQSRIQLRANGAVFEDILTLVDANTAVQHTQGTDAGTTGTTFQVDSDNTGPKLKNNSAVLEARNAADSAYANMRALGLTLGAALVIAGSITGVTSIAMTGAITGGTNITLSGTLQAEHLYSTDDAVIDDDLSVGGDLDVTGDLTAATGDIAIDNEASDKSIKARDHGTATTPEVVNVVYGTGSAPTASNTTEGTLFIKYVA